jgi:hypothetical protein
MSFVTVAPQLVSQAAGRLETIGSAISAAHATAAAPTVGVLPAAADEVSAAIAALFGSHAQQFQALSAQAATFHSQFVGLLNTGAGAYSSTEAANVLPLGEALLIAESLGPGVHQVGGTIFVIAGGEARRDTAILQKAVETDIAAVETDIGLNTGAGAHATVPSLATRLERDETLFVRKIERDVLLTGL